MRMVDMSMHRNNPLTRKPWSKYLMYTFSWKLVYVSTTCLDKYRYISMLPTEICYSSPSLKYFTRVSGGSFVVYKCTLNLWRMKYHWPVKSSDDQSQFYICLSIVLYTCTPQMSARVILDYKYNGIMGVASKRTLLPNISIHPHDKYQWQDCNFLQLSADHFLP